MDIKNDRNIFPVILITFYIILCKIKKGRTGQAPIRHESRSRCGFYSTLNIPAEKVGTFDTELVEEFFLGFTRAAACTLHIRQLAGRNSHHIIEGTFKAFARALRAAVAVDPAFADEIPSTKGVL